MRGVGNRPSTGPGVVETRLGDVGGLSAGGGQVENLDRGGTVGLVGGAGTMIGAFARAAGVADLRHGDGHGDQSGQQERCQSGHRCNLISPPRMNGGAGCQRRADGTTLGSHGLKRAPVA